MNKITWLHLSDIHFLPKTEWRDSHSRGQLLSYLQQQFDADPGLRPDLVFCTGDIAFGDLPGAPLASQYAQSAEFFTKLLAVCAERDAPLPRERLFVVPGNHDINRKSINRDAQELLYQKARESKAAMVDQMNQRFDDWPPEQQQIFQRLAEYQRFVQEFLPHQHDATGRVNYACRLAIHGVNLGIAGLNSAWSCAGDEDDRQLWLGAEWQLNRAHAQLQGADLRIGLMHHPTDNLNQTERAFMTRRMAGDFHFFLHGHSHDAWVHPGLPVTVVAGAVGAQGKDEFGFNLVQLDLVAKSGEVHLHHYDKTGWSIAPVPVHAPGGIWRFALPPTLQLSSAEGGRRTEPGSAGQSGPVAPESGPPAADSGTAAAAAGRVQRPPIMPDAGPMSLSNPWYVERRADTDAVRHFLNHGITVALKGGRGCGKSSLALRVQQTMRGRGWQVVNVDVSDDFTAADFASSHAFLLQLARHIMKQSQSGSASLSAFDFDPTPAAFKAFLQDLLPADSSAAPVKPLFLTLEHFDAIVGKPCCSEVLSALRGVHNAQSQAGEQHHVKLMLVHTVKPLQVGALGSIFDVARMVELADFSVAELEVLLARYDLPEVRVDDLHAFLGGHPFLTRLALNAMVENAIDWPELVRSARANGGVFHHHLQRLCQHFRSLPDSASLAQGFASLVKGGTLAKEELFEGLLALGLVRGSYRGDATVRCGLYADYLPKRLA